MLVQWARTALAGELTKEKGLQDEITLGNSTLGRSYEGGTVAALAYHATGLPADATFAADLRRMAGLVGRLYKAVDLGRTPVSDPPEIQAAIAAVASIAKALPGGGQGFGLTAKERAVIERHAMTAASAHLMTLGYKLKDVSQSSLYDKEATKIEEVIKVEVKGTTSGVDRILMTANEVRLHQESHPNNALIVVYDIVLQRGDPPSASGGSIAIWHTWALDASALVPLSYQYRLSKIT